uniref:Uncharacterized protein n=1 Tax=Avena sativa TaxID=4498 RepID=A0ACD5W5G6_AVESA
MAGVVSLWNNWEVHVLVIVSFLLQVFLLFFAGMRRRNISAVSRTLLWLAYLLADSIAIYILGHMSLSSKYNQHQLMAFWAPYLLVHLGGQDTITAYSIEDSKLWPRQLLDFAVQALGVAYVLYKYIAGSWTLVMAAMLIYISGVLKYGERILALKSSSIDNMSKLVDKMRWRRAHDHLAYRDQSVQWHLVKLGPEGVLQGAHDLLPICMAQFVDYKFWPSPSQCEAMKLLFDAKGCMYELIEMQLSLMHDILYTKAMVIHTRCGCFIRAVTAVATIATFFLFQSSIGKNDFNTVDVIVTYILIVGALVLEMAAFLKAMGSTWTCAWLCARRWDRLHKIALSARLCIKATRRNRRWSGSIGRPRLSNGIGPRGGGGWIRSTLHWIGWEDLHRSVISDGTKQLVLEEVCRMVKACEGKEEIMRGYSGQCALNVLGIAFEDPTSHAGITFDEKVTAWYFATEMFLSQPSRVEARQQDDIVEAIRAVSNYMIFLLIERSYMLPSPVRPGLYVNTEAAYMKLFGNTDLIEHIRKSIRTREEMDRRREDLDIIRNEENRKVEILSRRRGDFFMVMDERRELPSTRVASPPSGLARGAELARSLLDVEAPHKEVHRVVLGVWVEMLSYAAHHCSRDSHARQINSGGEFITIVWLL